MKYKDGLGRKERFSAATPPENFDVLDHSIPSLLRQAEELASFIRYYNLNNVHNGYFDEFLRELKQLRETLETGQEPVFKGNMDPAQAVLLAFIRHLHELSEQFNRRWDELPRWYLDRVLGVENQLPEQKKYRAAFCTEGNSTVIIPKGTPFSSIDRDGNPFFVRLEETLAVEPVETARVVASHYDCRQDLYPASALECVTSLEVRELYPTAHREEVMFGTKNSSRHSKSPGFVIVSPSLLLREGKRSVSVRLETEAPAMTAFLNRVKNHEESPFYGMQDDDIRNRLLTNIFHVEISTKEGWMPVSHPVVRYGDRIADNLILKFILDGEAPATAACNTEDHGFVSDYPALKIYLNTDAWLFPYTWIKDFRLKRIVINTRVEGITDVSVYNELGKIDNSKPFSPFGNNTEKGAWFAVGNYEMALKGSYSFDLHIDWEQLPEELSGLYDYYKAYDAGIDNTSFRIMPYYLNEYRWKTDPEQPVVHLFATTPQSPEGKPLRQAPLASQSTLENIRTDRMPPASASEDNFDYNIKTKEGFIRFVLEEPSIGFGEKKYRRLFSEQVIRKSLKKKESEWLNPPITPQIERLTLDYQSEEYIELRRCNASERNEFWHIYPLGYRQIYPNRENKTVPLVYSRKETAHLMIGLKSVSGGEYLRFYFDFAELNREADAGVLPNLKWYWGNGYHWKEIPDGVIFRDSTRNFIMNGFIEFNLPDAFAPDMFDPDGVLWLCASVSEREECIPELAGIHINAADLQFIPEEQAGALSAGSKKEGVYPVKNIPGLSSVIPIESGHPEKEEEKPVAKRLRVAEYVTHRGKAVTPRDYERIVLQEFPEVAKVKCLPAFDSKGGRKGVVTLAVIPAEAKPGKKGWRPKASSSLIIRLEEFLSTVCSARVSHADVINPEYEEVLVRCRVRFHPEFSTGSCRSRLKELCDGLIAPWQKERGIPVFGYSLQLSDVHRIIEAQEYVEGIEHLSLIRVTEKEEERFRIYEWKQGDDRIVPSKPYSILVPAVEHLFNCQADTNYGLDEMSVDETFVIEPA